MAKKQSDGGDIDREGSAKGEYKHEAARTPALIASGAWRSVLAGEGSPWACYAGCFSAITRTLSIWGV